MITTHTLYWLSGIYAACAVALAIGTTVHARRSRRRTIEILEQALWVVQHKRS